MKVEIAGHKQFTIKGEERFRDIPIGSVFIVSDDDSTYPSIWVKTPFADMCFRNNPVNQNGAFCNAVCINADGKNLYMQCNPEALCLVFDTENLFGTAECCQ